MKNDYTAKELMVIALRQLSPEAMEARRKRNAKRSTAKMKREGWRNLDSYKRTVR
jgi:hypothetical protein